MKNLLGRKFSFREVIYKSILDNIQQVVRNFQLVESKNAEMH